MKSKKKAIAAVMILFLVIEVIILANIYFYVKGLAQPGENVYSFNSDKITITKYDENKDEETTIIVKGKKREQIIKIFANASPHWLYNKEKFDYRYKLDFENGIRAAYLDVNEKIFETYDFFELTEDECRVIEDLFNKNLDKGED